jgi:uncharacterized membrane protein YbaN (DUF454 family)
MQHNAPKHVTGLRRVFYVTLGAFFVGVGIVGVFMPGLPATPFFLLAAYFTARSSPRFHTWLLNSRLTGPLIRDWQQHGGVRPRVKVVALTLIPLVVFSSAYFGRLPWYLVALLIVLALIGMTVVLRLKTVRDLPTQPEGDFHQKASTPTTTATNIMPAASNISTAPTPQR